MAKDEEISDEQWQLIERFFPQVEVRKDGKSCPRRADREVFNGVLWMLRTGARWCDLPSRYPPYQTCHRWYQEWVEGGVLREILEGLAEDLHKRGKIELSECFVDASFVGAKKGVPKSVKHAVARGQRSWQWQMLMVFQSPFTHEVLHQLKSPLYTKLSQCRSFYTQ